MSFDQALQTEDALLEAAVEIYDHDNEVVRADQELESKVGKEREDLLKRFGHA